MVTNKVKKDPTIKYMAVILSKQKSIKNSYSFDLNKTISDKFSG